MTDTVKFQGQTGSLPETAHFEPFRSAPDSLRVYAHLHFYETMHLHIHCTHTQNHTLEQTLQIDSNARADGFRQLQS